MSDAEIVDAISELTALLPITHWFCPRQTEQDEQLLYYEEDLEGGSEESSQEKDARQAALDNAADRKALFFKGVRIIAYDGDAAAPFQASLKEALKHQLTRCNICVRQYHRYRYDLRQELETDFDAHTCLTFMQRFDELNVARIREGLSEAKDTLSSLPVEKRKINVLGGAALFSLFETMHCTPLLKDNQLLSEIFDEPFRLAQTKRKFFLPEYTPAHTAFILGPDPERQSWAFYNWSKMQRDLRGAEFDWNVKGFLEKAMSRVQITALEKDFMPQFWKSVSTIMSKMSQPVIAHHLRGMESDLCKLALDHLQVDSPAFHDLLTVLQTYLETAPRDFWDALGSINAQSVVEQVFNSPNLESIAQESGFGDTEELQRSLAWIRPFVQSIRPGNLPPACRSLLHHLWSRQKKESYPGVARKSFRLAGLQVLSQAFTVCNQAGLASGTAIADLIKVVEPHAVQIVQEANTVTNKDQALVTASIDVISGAISADIVLLLSDRNALAHGRQLAPESRSASELLWSTVVRGSPTLELDLVNGILHGSSKLLVVDELTPQQTKNAPQDAATWETRLSQKHEHVKDLLEKLQDVGDASMARISANHDALTGLLALTFSGRIDTQQAAATTLRSLTGETSRREAVRALLKQNHTSSLKALYDIFKTIAQAQVLKPCLMVIKVGSDFLQALCDSQDGLLGSITLTSSEIDETERIWRAYWTIIRVIFDTTEQWSILGYDKDMLKEFCRDAMDFAGRTFDVYSIIAGALHTGSSSGAKDRIETDRRLLEYPASAAGSIAKWLRLRDEYLVGKAVNLICRMMGRLQDVDLELPATALEFVSDIVEDAIRNKIPAAQKAQLRKARDTHLDVTLDKPGTPAETLAVRQGSLASWATSGTQSTAQSRPSERRRDVIDLESWKSKADQQKGSRLEKASVIDQITSSAAATQDRLRASGLLSRLSGPSSTPPAQALQSGRNEFLAKRKAAEEARRKRDQAAIAEANKSRAGIAHAGSGLTGIGVEGKDHSVRGQNVMVSSDESSDDEGQLDEDLFGPSAKQSKKRDTVRQDAANAVGLKREIKPTKITRQVRSKKDMRARLQPDLSTLHRIILSWDFFHDGDYPPNSDRTQYRKVMNTFQHVEDYKEVFEPLLTLEAWQAVVRAREEDQSKPFEIKFSNRMSVDSFVELSSTIPQAELRDLQISEGDIILLSQDRKPTSASQAPHCLARVSGIKRKGKMPEIIYKVVADNNSLNAALKPGALINAVKVQSIIPLEREYGAIKGLVYYDLCDEIVRARPSPLLKYTDKQLDPLISNYNVNKAQAKAIKSAVDNDAFTLIQGPPGSGKTKTIVAIVGALLTDSILASNGSTRVRVPGAQANDSMAKKLLVCAPSNAAVDELVMRLKEGIRTLRGADKKLNVLRLGRSEAINSAVVDVTLDELVNKRLGSQTKSNERSQAIFHEHKKVSEALRELRDKVDAPTTKSEEKSKLQDELHMLRRRKNELGTQIDNVKDAENTASRDADMKKKQVQQEIINDSHVICATLSGAGHDLFQSLNVEFETVIVDEAAQCVEMSALIPLKYGCAKCILVGDPKQLPPTVFSKEAARFQYEQSLFVRMQGNHPDAVHLLDAQYRMHPHISAFPSATFYDGRLLDGKDMAGLRQREWHKSSLLAPYRFFDVQGQHSAAPKGHSLVNAAEVDIAMLLYERLLKDFRDYDFTQKIGIITPYKSQLRLLKETFAQRHGQEILERVEFNTTDAFQGRESEIIIFSCVRASPAGGIGFLQDIRRMNVGLTRAKCSLWVLGNSQSLSRGEYWKKLVDDAKARNLHTSGDLRGMLRQPSSNFVTKERKQSIKEEQDVKTTNATVQGQTLDKGPGKANGTLSKRVVESRPSNLAMFSSNTGSAKAAADIKQVSVKSEAEQKSRKGSDPDAMEGVRVRAVDRLAHVKTERLAPAKREDMMDIDPPTKLKVSAFKEEVTSGASRDVTPATSRGSRDATPASSVNSVNGANGSARGEVQPGHGVGPPPPAKRKAASSVFMPKKKR